MNNSALKLFHELMKKGWIDRNDNSLMWNLVEDNEARDELDQMGIELGFEIIQAQDRIYMVPTQDNDLFLKNNVDYRADIKATNEVRSRDLYLMNYLAIWMILNIWELCVNRALRMSKAPDRSIFYVQERKLDDELKAEIISDQEKKKVHRVAKFEEFVSSIEAGDSAEMLVRKALNIGE